MKVPELTRPEVPPLETPGNRCFGRFELRPGQRQLLLEGAAVPLGGRAFDVLLALAEAGGRVVSKAELLDRVWPGLVVEENNLQQQISALRKVLGTRAIATVSGRGYRLADTQADTGSPVPRHNLPQPRTRFVGREAALADCGRLLTQARLLSLTGIGGCGKTRLAQQVAQQQLAAFPDGVWFIDLEPVRDPTRVPASVAATLGVAEESGSSLLGRLITHLSARRVLLVLDNCEHLVDAVVALSEALLAACPDLRLLATSREALGVMGEQIYAVGSLTLPASTDLDAVLGSEAARVFADRARLALPDFAVVPANAAAIAQVCRRLDGIALAIELAAARVKLLSVDEILVRLNDRFRLLTGGSPALPRHQTLQAVMRWSYEHLTDAEQLLFRELSVFAAGWTLAGAAHVAAIADDYAVLELLTRLHDKSLLIVDRAPAEPRYRMLETVRQYAQERLSEADDGAEVRTRHLRYCVALAEAAEPHLTGAEQGMWMARLQSEQEDLLAAHAWCSCTTEGAALGLRLVGSLWRYWSSSAQLERGYGLTRAGLEAAGPNAADRDRCRALLGLGQIAFRMGRYGETLACAAEGLALARSDGDAGQIALGLALLGNGLSATGRAQAAASHYEEARDCARAAGDRFQLASVLNNLAEVHRAQGQFSAAQACYEESLAVGRELGNAGITAIVACNLARLLVAAGDHAGARTRLLECQAIAGAAGLKGLGEDWLEVAASLAVAVGDHASGARLHGASLARMQEAGARREAVDAAFIQPLMDEARATLGAAAFDAAESAGRALNFDASMLALKAWLERSAPR